MIGLVEDKSMNSDVEVVVPTDSSEGESEAADDLVHGTHSHSIYALQDCAVQQCRMGDLHGLRW